MSPKELETQKCGFSRFLLTILTQIITKLSLRLYLPNVFQNGFSSSRGATLSEELEPEPFSEEPEPCQTGHVIVYGSWQQAALSARWRTADSLGRCQPFKSARTASKHPPCSFGLV